ncbi:DUF3861 domain-containing protein [Vibrio gallicus]|uniref:DUF3861 domain-containing protein n=1 Tax=Vibrio gallicus TaxID=190897 RepID=UPI0021C30486|nr:DUF3861 domain-containing protein [Vibrio gallicus]
MERLVKKGHTYRVVIEEIGNEDLNSAQSLEFEFQDREDLFNAVQNIRKGSGLESDKATRVAVALRLLGPIMMADRKHPLFIDFMPHFKTFMQNLKTTVKNAIS